MSAPARETQSRGGDPVRPAATGRGPAAPEAHALAELQQALGNLGVIQRLPDPAIQARLEVGAPRRRLRARGRRRRRVDRWAAPTARVGATGVRPRARCAVAPRTTTRRSHLRAQPAPQRAAGATAKAPPATKPAVPWSSAPAAAPKAPTPTAAATPATKPPTPAVAKAPKAPSKPKLPERKRDELLVATRATPGATPSVTPAAARTIQSQQGGGQPLPTADRGFFESRLGRDLGSVRLHDDAPARAAAREVQAQAFTYGQDVYFGAGGYQPGTRCRPRAARPRARAHDPAAPRRADRATRTAGDGQAGNPVATKTTPATPAATPKVTTPRMALAPTPRRRRRSPLAPRTRSPSAPPGAEVPPAGRSGHRTRDMHRR